MNAMRLAGYRVAGVVLAALMIVGQVSAQTDTASSPPASAETGEVAQLRDIVADLQRQVDELKSANDDKWLTQQRADQVRALVHDVLADADTRASLLQSGAAAGWDNGFFIASSDSNYLLKIGGQLQIRYVYNLQDGSPTDDNRSGFEVRRAKMDFQGHVFDPSWRYHVEMDVSRTSGAVSLGENGWVQKDLGNGLKLRFGQFKPLMTREESISSRRLQGVERSQVHTQFTAGIAQGVQAMYESDHFRLNAAFIDGAGTGNTGWSSEDTEYAFTARGEFLAFGEWKMFEDDNGWRNGGAGAGGLMLGAGGLFQNQEFGTGSGTPFNDDEVENLTLTADATFKASGFSIIGEVFYRSLSSDGTTDTDLDQYGLVVRGGFFVRDDIEIYAMYEWGDLDIDDVENLSVATVGFSKFFNKHSLKWQNDIGYGFNSVASAWAVDSAGWRPDATDEDGQIVIRSQFQLLF